MSSSGVQPYAAVQQQQQQQPTGQRDRAYAEWYAWALPQWSDAGKARAAAAAAVGVLEMGGDPQAASQAAARAATGQVPPVEPGPRRRAYGEWFVWAQQQLRLHGDQAHRAAAAAVEAAAAGATGAQAAERARAVAFGVPPAATAPAPTPGPTVPAGRPRGGPISWYRDSAIRGVIWGCIALVLVLTVGRVLLVTPFIGLLYAVRALRGSRVAIGVTGVVLNGAACAVAIVTLVLKASGS